jgi:membrane-bound ClpP family serine protease
MSTSQIQSARGYRLSFVINTVLGGVMLVLGIVGIVIEVMAPSLRGSLAWGFLPAAIVCLSIGFAHRSKYLSLSR